MKCIKKTNLSKQWIVPLVFLMGLFNFNQAWSNPIANTPLHPQLTAFLKPTPVSTQRPERVISLAPHITELLFSAGAGNKVVGVVEYSNFPKAALDIDNVGRYNAINIEKIIQLKPDLIIAWKSANRPKDINKLTSLGLKVMFSDPNQLDDIPTEIRHFGRQLNTSKTANLVANQLEQQLKTLRQTYQSKPTISAFYQIWNAPIMTVNGKQFMSQALNLCGAQNSFANLPLLAAEINIESVIAKNPDVILLGGEKTMQQTWLDHWKKWRTVKAVNNQHIYMLNADTFQRPTQRFIEGIEQLCQTLDQARVN